MDVKIILKNYPQKKYLNIVVEHIPCGYSMSTIWTFDGIENNYDVNRGKYCMKKFCKCLTEHAMQIINFEKKKIMPLTNGEYKLYLSQTNCHIYKQKFGDKYTNDKKYCIVTDHCHYTGKYRSAANSICNLKYNISKFLFFFTMDQTMIVILL